MISPTWRSSNSFDLLDHGAACFMERVIKLVQLIAALGLNAEMVDTSLPAQS